MAGLTTLTSQLIQRLSLASRAGLQFGGKRDLYSIFGYKRSLFYKDYLDKFHRQDVAKRVISAPVAATWRTPPIVKRITDTAGGTFQKEWESIVAKEHVWKKLERADKLSGIGNYSILLIGISGQKDLSKPVVKKNGNRLLFLQPYAQPNAQIIELDTDVTSERFGKPLFYKIRMHDPLTGIQTGNIGSVLNQVVKEIKVHHSHVLHIAEDTLESDILGTPRLEAIYNLLDDLLKVAGGTAETFWLTGNRGLQADIDKDAELNADDAKALSDMLDEYQHQLRRVIKTKGVSLNTLGSDVPSPKEIFNMIVALISGTTGIPRRILTGSEAGQLASEQDRANWADRTNERRFNFAEPCMLTPLILKLVAAGVLNDIGADEIEYRWPSNFQLTPLENAQTMAQKARATINLAKHFSEDNPFISIIEARRILELPDDVEGEIPSPSNKNKNVKKGQQKNTQDAPPLKK